MKRALSIVMPVLNEAQTLKENLMALEPLRRRGCQVYVVDGGSFDGSMEIAKQHADHAMSAPRGRALQMNAGAAASTGDALLFLHADTRLPNGADRLALLALNQGRAWGRFDVQLESPRPLLRLVSRLINWRSKLTGIATGDQAIFVTREAFEAVGGFPEIPLMEDVAITDRLRRLGPPACIGIPVITSARRWERHGALRTIFLMWRLRLEFFLGVSPQTLARRYVYHPPKQQ